MVIVCVVVVGEQEVQEKSALDCWRIYLFSRIVRGMLRALDSFRVIAESNCKAVQRQLHGVLATDGVGGNAVGTREPVAEL
jgi:hypothetical protein